jgi:type VI protein secretion system component Hcp
MIARIVVTGLCFAGMSAAVAVSTATAQESAARAQADVTLPASQTAPPPGGYIRFDGVDGTAPAASGGKDFYKGWIEINSIGSARTADGGSLPRSQGAGTLTFVLSRSNAALAEACAQRRALGTVRLHLPATQGRAGYDEYLLSDARIGACSQTRSTERPVENITLNFSRLEFSTTVADPDLPVVIGR